MIVDSDKLGLQNVDVLVVLEMPCQNKRKVLIGWDLDVTCVSVSSSAMSVVDAVSVVVGRCYVMVDGQTVAVNGGWPVAVVMKGDP